MPLGIYPWGDRLMSVFSNRVSWIIAVVGGGFLARLVTVWFLDIQPVSDFAHYVHMAASMAETGNMQDKFGNVAFYSAGYSLFLAPFFALFGATPETAQGVNALLGGLSIFLVYLCASRVLPNWRWALLAAALWAAYPASIVYTEYVAKENLMVPLLLLQTCLLLQFPTSRHKRPLAVALGLVFGAGMLVGAAIVFTGGIIALVVLLTQKDQPLSARILTLLAFVVAAVAAVSPWLAYTHARLGQPVLSSNGPFNLYLGNNPNNPTPYYQGIEDTPMGPHWRALRAEKGHLEAMRTLGEQARQYMLENPGRTLALALHKMAAFWYPPLHSAEGGEDSRAEMLVRRAWLGFYLLMIALALVPLVFFRRINDRTMILYGTVLAYCGVHGIAYVIFRYRLPIMPLVAVLAAAGAYLLWRRFSGSPGVDRLE